MKNILTSVIASLLLFPSLASADPRSNYNSQQIEAGREEAKCRNLFVNAQFRSTQWQILTGKGFQIRFNVDNVGNIIQVSDDLNGGRCRYNDIEMQVNVISNGDLYSCVYHIEDAGLVKYCETTYESEDDVKRVVHPFV